MAAAGYAESVCVELQDYRDVRGTYDRRERFDSRAADIESLGFDARFRRLWQFYLAFSEAGFRSRYLDVRHFVLDRPEEQQ
nr:hypothetical protein [Nocardia sp.]